MSSPSLNLHFVARDPEDQLPELYETEASLQAKIDALKTDSKWHKKFPVARQILRLQRKIQAMHGEHFNDAYLDSPSTPRKSAQ